MSKLLKLLKALKKAGFATKAQKAEVKALYKELEGEDQEAVKEEVQEAEALPEADPNAEPGEGEEKVDEEIEKSIKSIVSRSVKSATKEEVASATESIKAEVKTFFDKMKAEMEAKAGKFHPDTAEKRKTINSYLRKLSFALLNNDVEGLRELTAKEMTTDATGSPFAGYVVDRELSAEIRHLITEYGVARREMMAVALTKHSYDANALVTDVTVSWVSEAGSIGSTQAVLGQESLTLKKLAAIVTLTRELIEDEEIDLFSFLGARVAEGFARKEDAAAFIGEGTGDTANGEFTGILYNASVNEVVITGANNDEFTSLTADHLLDMQDESPQWVAANGKYYMHRSIRNLVRKLKDEQGNYIYQNPSENSPAMIWGRPVVEVEVMPSVADSAGDTPFVLFADLKKSSILGYKSGIQADRFNAGIVRNVAGNADINLITTDREAIRWIERVGYVTILPSAATVLKTGSGS